MPKIVIKEYDKTKNEVNDRSNFAVVVPGFVASNKGSTGFDKNDVCTLNTVDEFITHVGIRENIAADAEATSAHYGNQIAYELLALGYTVLFKKIKETATTSGETVGLDSLATSDFWECFKDKATYNFRYILTGCVTDKCVSDGTTADAASRIVDIATYLNTGATEDTNGRGDVIALVDIARDEYETKSQKAAIEAIKTIVNANTCKANKYTAFFAPWVEYENLPLVDTSATVETTVYKNNCLPGSFYYLDCAARAFQHYAEWYAVAGYKRGISNYKVLGTSCSFGTVAVNALAPRYYTSTSVKRAVNLVVENRDGFYLWGNRTAEVIGGSSTQDGLLASHFLNIRQLCTTLKKEIYTACKEFSFEPNSDLLWVNWCNRIRPTLDKMKADQGIEDYKFVQLSTNKRATLKAKIRIVPIEAVEDFDISVTLEDSLGEVTAEIDE